MCKFYCSFSVDSDCCCPWRPRLKGTTVNSFKIITFPFLLPSMMPEPQINEESAQLTSEQIIQEKKSSNSSKINENSKDICDLKDAESFSLNLDSYNFDAFISKMRHESCKPVLENIKR